MMIDTLEFRPPDFAVAIHIRFAENCEQRGERKPICTGSEQNSKQHSGRGMRNTMSRLVGATRRLVHEQSLLSDSARIVF